MLAVAIAREVLEIDAPDNSAFDSLPMGDEPTDSFVPSRRRLAWQRVHLLLSSFPTHGVFSKGVGA